MSSPLEKFKANPKDTATFETLAQRFAVDGNWQDLAQLLIIRAQGLKDEDPSESARQFLEAGKIYREHLRDRARAKKAFSYVLALYPTHRESFKALEDMHIQDEEWPRLIELYLNFAQGLKAAAQKSELLHKAGKIWETRLASPDKAIVCYQKAYTLSPDNVNILADLEAICVENAQWEEAVKALESRCKLEEDRQIRCRLYAKLGQILARKLEDPVRAAKCYREILNIFEDTATLNVLTDLYAKAEDWPNLAFILELKLKYAETPQEKVEICTRLAIIMLKYIGDHEKAISWYRRAISETPDDLKLLRTLKDLLESLGRTEEWIKCSREELQLVTSKEDKVAILSKMGNVLADNAYDLSRAAETYEEIFLYDPSNTNAIDVLKRIYLTLENYESLVKTLHREVDLTSDIDKPPLYFRIAEILASNLAQEKESVTCYHKILEIDGMNREATRKLRDFYTRHRLHTDLVKIIEREIQIDPTQALEKYLEIGEIYRDRLSDKESATKAFEKALEVDSRCLPALVALRSLYKEAKRWNDYIQVCLQEISLSTQVDHILNLHFSLAELHLKREELSEAETHFEAILQLDLANTRALSSIKEIYSAQGKWSDYIRILEREAHLFGDHQDLPKRYAEIAELYRDTIRDREQSIHYYERALTLDPHNWDFLTALEAEYQATKQYEALVGILERKARLTPDPTVSRDLRLQIGIMWEEKIENPPYAIRAYHHVLDMEPTNSESLDRLEKLYTSRQEYDELVKTLQLKVRVVEDKSVLVSIYIQIAKLAQEELADIELAIQNYRQILRIFPKHLETIESLIVIFQKEERWEELSEIYNLKLAAWPENASATSTLFKLASLYLTRLEAPDKAASTYRDILAKEPSNMDAIHALQEVSGKLSDAEGLMDAYKREAEYTQDVEQLVYLYSSMGRLCEEMLHWDEEGINCYKKVLEYVPKHLDSVRALHRLYVKTSHYKELAEIIEKEIELTENPASKVSLLLEKGAIARDRMNAPVQAILAFERVLTLAPSSPEALNGLEILYKREKQYQDLIKILEIRSKLSDDQAKKLLLIEIARIWEDYLGEDAKAEECLIESLALDPAYLPVLNSLNSIYRRNERWEDVIRILDTELAHTEKPDRRIQIYFTIGKIWEENLKDTAKATAMYDKVIRIDRQNLPALKSLQEIYTRENKYDTLVKVYLTELNIPDIDADLRVTINIECAEILEEKLGERGRAISHYRNVLKLAPENLIALRGIQTLFRRDGSYTELAEVLEKEITIETDQRRLYCVHMELGELYRDHLTLPKESIRHFTKAHEYRTKERDVLKAIMPLLASEERWEEYVQYGEKKLALCKKGEGELLSLHLDLGKVYEWNLDNLDLSVQHLEAALDIDARCIDAIHSLERLYQRKNLVAKLVNMYQMETELTKDKKRLLFLHQEAGKLNASVLSKPGEAITHFCEVMTLDPQNKDVVPTLFHLYGKLSNWKELAGLCQVAIRNASTLEEKVDYILKGATLWRKKLGKDNRSLALYQTALMLVPDNLVAIRSMRRILEQYGDWHGAIELLKKEIPLVESKEKVALYLRMGEIWEKRLGLLQQALKAYQEVLEIRFHLPTAKQMLRLMEQVEDYEGLADLLGKVIKGTEDVAEKTDELCWLGEVLYRKLSRLDKAVEAYANALKFNPPKEKEEAILNVLEEILSQKESWQNLVTVKERKLELISDPEQQRRLCYDLGQIYESYIYNEKKAILNYERSLELAPEDLNVITSLEDLYREWGFFEELVDLCQREVDLQENKKRKIELFTEIGDIWEKRLFDDTKAIVSHEAILALDPLCENAILSLARLYERTENFEKLLEIQKIRLSLSEKKGDAQEVLRLQISIGKLLAYSLERAEEAIDIFQKIHSQQPQNMEVMMVLEELYSWKGDYPNLVSVLEQKIKLITEEGELIPVYLKLARICEEELEDKQKATDAYLNVRKLRWDNAEALKGLRRLYKEGGNWSELVEITRQTATATEEPEEKAALCTEMGELWRDKFGQLERAQEDFEKALRVCPGFRPAIEALIDIYSGQDRWEKVIETLTMWLEFTQDSAEKVKILTWRGSVYLKNMKKEDEAIKDYHKALDIDPENLPSINSLAALYYNKGLWDKAEPFYDQLSRRLEKDATKEAGEIFYRQGKICERLGRKEEAILKYRRSMGICPEYLIALEALGNLYYEYGQWDPALPIYIKIHNLKGGAGEGITEVHLRLAVIKDKMGMADGAIEGYTRVLEERPHDTLCLESLARLYMDRGEEERAIKYLRILVKSEDKPEVAKKALKTIAKISEELEEPLEATKYYEEIFQREPENLDVLQKLALLYKQINQWEKAKEKANMYCQLVKTDTAKRDSLMILARILYDGLKDIAGSISCYRKALSLFPTHIPIIRAMAHIYEDIGKWEEVVKVYQSYVKSLPPEDSEKSIPIQMSMAFVLSEKLSNIKDAINVYRQILSILPDHVGAHAALAALQARFPSSHEGAVSEHIYLLLRDPMRTSSYHELFQIYCEGKETDRALLCCRALQFLGELLPDEQSFFSRGRRRKPGRLDPASILFFLHQGGKGVLLNFLSQIDPYTEKAYPSQLEERYGLRKKDRLGPESGELIRAFVSDVMKSLGIADLFLYLDGSGKAVLENTTPPSLIVGRQLLTQLRDDELRFVLGKYLFYVSQNHVMSAKLSSDEFKKYVTNFVEAFADTGRKRTADEEALSRKLRGGLPRKLRKTFEERLDLLTEVHEADPLAFKSAMEVASNRCGYFFSDSLESTASAIMKLSGKSDIRPKDMPEMSDILKFNLSEEYYKLRMTAGLAIMETLI